MLHYDLITWLKLILGSICSHTIRIGWPYTEHNVPFHRVH